MTIKFTFDTQGLNMDDIPSSDVTRLIDRKGAHVNWGYQDGTMFWVVRQGTGPNVKFTTGYSDDIPNDAEFYCGQEKGGCSYSNPPRGYDIFSNKH